MKIYFSSIVNVYDDGEGNISFSLQSQGEIRKADVGEAVNAMKQKGYWEAFCSQFPIQSKMFEAITNGEHCDMFRLRYNLF